MALKKEYYYPLIKLALEEDIRDGDITSEAILDRNSESKALLISKSEGIICGLDVFCYTMLEVNSSLKFDVFFKDGDNIKKDDVILELSGNTISILKSERTALNFIQRMSGIATKTYNYASKIKDYYTQILDTRKTLPGFRMLDKYAVYIGGAKNHRFGLYDMFLIKENHIKAAKGITKAITKARNYMPDIKIEVETTNIDEVKEACKSHPDVIMLDNMDNETVKKAVLIIKNYNTQNYKEIKTEASGNITEERLIALSKIGIDYISMGELTHSVKAFDISLLIK